MALSRCATTLGLTLLLASACDDPPIVTGAADAELTIAADATVEGGFNLSACEACVASPDVPGPGCGTENSACVADPACNGMIACAFGTGCVGGPAAKFITCALPCAVEAGALDDDSPAIALASPLFQCLVNGACAAVCLVN